METGFGANGGRLITSSFRGVGLVTSGDSVPSLGRAWRSIGGPVLLMSPPWEREGGPMGIPLTSFPPLERWELNIFSTIGLAALRATSLSSEYGQLKRMTHISPLACDAVCVKVHSNGSTGLSEYQTVSFGRPVQFRKFQKSLVNLVGRSTVVQRNSQNLDHVDSEKLMEFTSSQKFICW